MFAQQVLQNKNQTASLFLQAIMFSIFVYHCTVVRQHAVPERKTFQSNFNQWTARKGGRVARLRHRRSGLVPVRKVCFERGGSADVKELGEQLNG